MDLGHFQQAIRHGRCPHPGLTNARDYGDQFPLPVRAILELGRIAQRVLAADHTVDTGDCRLEIAQRCVYPYERRRACLGCARSGFYGLMHASGVGRVGEAQQSITERYAGEIEASFAEARKRRAAQTDDTAEFQAHLLAFLRGVERSDERRLAGSLSPCLLAQAITTETGVGGLDLFG